MTFFALLTKELRMRMRRERTNWIIIGYVLLMGLLGWFFISRYNIALGYSSNGLSDTGISLYTLLAQAQLLLLVFLTPSFTASTVNGEKEQLTFDMLLCSRLSAFSLIGAKLVAGLLNALLLMAAAIPLFSLVFFFGGVSATQFLHGVLVFIATALTIATLGIFCSTIFQRPGISASLTYMLGVIWLFLPLITLYIINATADITGSTQTAPPAAAWFQVSTAAQNSQAIQAQPLLIWNPIMALFSTYGTGANITPYVLRGLRIPPWAAYSLLCLLASTILFLLSVWLVKPNPLGRLRGLRRKHPVPAPTPV